MEYARLQMDWLAIRRELRKARKEAKKAGLKVSGPQLQAATGIAPSTLSRIESVSKYPDHKPDLETVEALSKAMGLTLSQFFARVEGGSDRAVALPIHAENSAAQTAAEHLSTQEYIVGAAASINEAIRELGERLVKAWEQNAAPRAGEARSDAGDRKTG